MEMVVPFRVHEHEKPRSHGRMPSECRVCCSKSEKKTEKKEAEKEEYDFFASSSDDERDWDALEAEWEAEEDAFCNDGMRHFTPEERETYCRQVLESDGFDVDDFPNIYLIGIIAPFALVHPVAKDIVSTCAKEALKEYNQKEKAQLEFVEVDKVNAQTARGIKYYITFQARDSGAADGPTKTFQALVLYGIPEPDKSQIEVICCRPKGAPNQERIRIALP